MYWYIIGSLLSKKKKPYISPDLKTNMSHSWITSMSEMQIKEKTIIIHIKKNLSKKVFVKKKLHHISKSNLWTYSFVVFSSFPIHLFDA